MTVTPTFKRIRSMDEKLISKNRLVNRFRMGIILVVPKSPLET